MQKEVIVSKRSNQFFYTISGNDTVVVVNFMGSAQNVEPHAIGELLQKILIRENIKHVIFRFSQVNVVSVDFLRSIARLQKGIKAKSSRIHICSMPSDLNEKLERSGKFKLQESSKQSIRPYKSKAA